MILKTLVEDLEKNNLVGVSKAGHGKSTLFRRIAYEVKLKGFEVKIFDISQAWFHDSPVDYRVLVTPKNMEMVANRDSCVYEIGLLNTEQRKEFVARILKEDYEDRYDGWLDGHKDFVPYAFYVFEEANTYFSSTSMKTKDWKGQILRDFISAGRNYKMRGLYISTACSGELDTMIRKRSNWVVGLITNESDYQELRNSTTPALARLAKKLPQYRFLYHNGQIEVQSFIIEPTKKHTPMSVDESIVTSVVPKSGTSNTLNIPTYEPEPFNVTWAWLIIFFIFLFWLLGALARIGVINVN